jgi:hypothetical protein
MNKYVLMCNANGYGKFGNLLNTKIFYVMSPFEDMVIDLKFTYSSWEIMYIYNKQHQDYVGFDCMKCYFACAKGLPLGVLMLEGQDGQT